MTCDATHGIDFNSGGSKAPLDLPRDTAANCASVTSVGRVCMYTDAAGGCVGDGSTCRAFVMLSGAQTITGDKTLSGTTTFNGNVVGGVAGAQTFLKGAGTLGIGGSVGNNVGPSIYANGSIVEQTLGGTAQTTSTTATSFLTLTLGTGNAYIVTANILARCNSGTSCTGGGRGYSTILRRTFYNTAGTLTSEGSQQVIGSVFDDITGTQTVALTSGATDCGSATAICVKVSTDTTNETINWIGLLRFMQVS